jgi:hypothetical protein
MAEMGSGSGLAHHYVRLRVPRPGATSLTAKAPSSPMRIRLHDPNLITDLRFIFERSGFIVTDDPPDAVVVTAPEAMEPKRAEEDAALILMLWRAMHPGVTAEPPDPSSR